VLTILTEPNPIEIIYRGKTYSGQWRLEGATLHVTSAIGSTSRPAFTIRQVSPPS